MGSSKKQTVGFQYYMGAHFALCHGPIDKITHILVDDRVAWNGVSTGGSITISQPDLFGGEAREGGISGTLDIAMGGPAQVPNDYLVSKLGANVPSFRGIVGVILRQAYVGNNPYLKPWKFRATRILQSTRGAAQWYSAKAAIGDDMNPAHIIREALTNSEWGMGYNELDMDDAFFTAAADALYAEGFGLSFLWSREAPIDEFVSDVIEHIDGALYVDRVTGKFRLKLIRADYVTGSLPVLDVNNVIKVRDYASSALSELVNSITVNYWDLSTGKDSSVSAQDIALINTQGGVSNASQTYNGVTNGTLAAKLAARDLQVMSNPIVRCVITANRTASGLNVGDPFRLSWPDYGVSDIVMRVGTITLGSATDGRVEITAVQDVFGLSSVLFVPPAPIAWTNPISAPANMPNRFVKEATYLELVQNLSQRTVDDGLAAEPLAGYLMATGVRVSSDTINAALYVDSGAGYAENGVVDLCPSAVTTASLSKTGTSVAITGGVDLEQVVVGSLAQIGNEVMSVTSISTSSVGLGRGVLDTVPLAHSSGARIFFWSDAVGSDQVEYVSGEVVNVKMLPRTGQGQLALASATASSVTFGARAIRPYPPGQWQINSSYFPALVENVALATSWAHRNRAQQTGASVLTFFSGGITVEPGTTYSIRLYNHTTSALLHSVDGLTGTSYASFPVLTGAYVLRMELWSVRDTYASFTKHEHIFNYSNTV